MPSLAEQLEQWYHDGGAVGVSAPRTVRELVDALGGPGRGGGVHRAAELLGINPSTGKTYTDRAVQRYIAEEARTERRTMAPAVEAAFNRGIARRYLRGRVRIVLGDTDLKISEIEQHRKKMDTAAGEHPTGAQLAPVLDRLARGDAAGAADLFGGLFLRAYGIPQGAMRSFTFGDVGALEIAPARR